MADVADPSGTEDDRAEPVKPVEDQVEAREETPEDKPAKVKKKRPFWIELPILVGIALLLAVLIQTVFARVFVIPSESMEKTLNGCAGCYGDRVLVDKVVYYFNDPAPGDVVVFHRPSTWDHTEFKADRSSNPIMRGLQRFGSLFGLASPDEDDVVKRVIAVGGQKVRCCDEQNRVLVDDKALTEPYIYWMPDSGNTQQEFPEITVPDGMLWVMGDNRNDSCDSRCQGGGGSNGLVPVDNVIGKVRAIVLPPSRWQGVGDHDPQVMASAPAWQQGIPLGAGFALSFPTLLFGRKLRAALRRSRDDRT